MQMDSIKNTRTRLTISSIGDISDAFDTIWRDKLIEITEELLEEDKMRIVRVLLSDTNRTILPLALEK